MDTLKARPRWHEDLSSLGTSPGNLAWAAIALLELHKKTVDTLYLYAAERLCTWIQNNCVDSTGDGGFNGGAVAVAVKGEDSVDIVMKEWKSVEHSIDIFVAFMRLYEQTNDSTWLQGALHARAFVESMWNDLDSVGHFWTGTLDDGVSINDQSLPLDVNTWALMAFGDTASHGKSVVWCEQNCFVETCPKDSQFQGFDFNTDLDGVWFEGTAQMAIAYQMIRRDDAADTVLAELGRVQASVSGPAAGGLFAACHDSVSTGFDWYYHRRPHVGATAWYIFALMEHNPYWGISSHHPVACADWSITR
jgi:hypothetical protein